jgi:hypothetical protein
MDHDLGELKTPGGSGKGGGYPARYKSEALSLGSPCAWHRRVIRRKRQ